MERLPQLYAQDVNPMGHLEGPRVSISDLKGADVASSVFRYAYHPFEHQDSFDQVNAYYHFQRAHRRFAGTLGVRNASWFDKGDPILVRVNATGTCGAVYSPDLEGNGRPGFTFADQDNCGSSHEDFSRDSDVIYHEYTHGILDWTGIDLGLAPLNSYQRAVNEAVADYHAANFTGDPLLGGVAGEPRSLDNSKVYPDDVPCDEFDRREEHCTGEIWGGLLWDLQSAVGSGAEQLEFASLDHLVDRWPDGHVATWIDFWDATFALLEADRELHDGANGSLIYGVAASRGLLGPLSFVDDHVSVIYEELSRESKFKSIGWIYGPKQRVPYYFSAPDGRAVTIRVRSTSSLQPGFVLRNGAGSGSAIVAASERPVRAGGVLRSVLPPTASLYVLEVFALDGAETGTFQISIAVH